jgi:hypothetical protein
MTAFATQQHEAALRLLQSVVHDRLASGRRTHSAGLKPAMQQRSNQGFSETRLGFPSFRAFLEWAQDAGAVRLVPAPTGPDIEVLPVQPAAERAIPSYEGRGFRRRIRADLWRSFVDWRPDWRRVFDRESGEARMFPREPHEVGDAPEHAALRAAVASTPNRFVEIAPIAQDVQLAWMREFADAEIDSPFKLELQAALRDNRPAGAFATRLRQSPTALHRWNRSREQRVAAVIQEWAANHQLDLTIYDEPQRRVVEAPRLFVETMDDQTLRERLHEAIDKMPLAELLRLPIPLEYLISR